MSVASCGNKNKHREEKMVWQIEVLYSLGLWRKLLGTIHSTKISGNFGPKLNGLVRSNRKSFEKMVHLLRWTTFSGRTGLNFGWMDHAHYNKSYLFKIKSCNLHATYLCSSFNALKSQTFVKKRGLLPVSKPNGIPWLANKQAQYTATKIEHSITPYFLRTHDFREP